TSRRSFRAGPRCASSRPTRRRVVFRACSKVTPPPYIAGSSCPTGRSSPPATIARCASGQPRERGARSRAQPLRFGTSTSRRSGPGHVVRCSAFSLDGSMLATGAVDGLVRIWDLRKGAYRDWAGHTGTVVALAYTPTGTLVSASADRTVRLWDSKGEARVLRGHDGDITSMRLSPDGAHAVTASADHT